LNFSISQHTRDKALLKSFVNYLSCGRYSEPLNRNEIYFFVSVLSDIVEKIVPMFNKYPLIGVKKKNYLDFLKVVELIRNKNHLTKEGLEEVIKIKNNMNSRRMETNSLERDN
jgi:hypothetical protein